MKAGPPSGSSVSAFTRSLPTSQVMSPCPDYTPPVGFFPRFHHWAKGIKGIKDSGHISHIAKKMLSTETGC